LYSSLRSSLAAQRAVIVLVANSLPQTTNRYLLYGGIYGVKSNEFHIDEQQDLIFQQHKALLDQGGAMLHPMLGSL